MATASTRTLLTERDLEILTALDRCPLTAEQLQKVSSTFTLPFQSDSRVRGRLQALRQAGWVRRWQYATSHRGGAPDYYKLSLDGYRILHGPDAQPPTKRAFGEIGIAHQHHTRCLAEFIVHTTVSAHRQGLAVADFCRENTLRLRIGEESLFPDCAFRIVLPDQQLNFLVELDNGTERVRSERDADSWERKIRLYDAYQDGLQQSRFRVLIVTTRNTHRLGTLLDAAAALTRNRQRSLFYGVHLGDYLREPAAAAAPCFLDHERRPVALVPPALPLRVEPQAVLARQSVL